MGLFLVLFLFEHLLTNSEAALFVGEDGVGFVRMVNFIHSLPYLPVIEIALLGVPFLIHGIWGILYLRTSKANAGKSNGSTPALGEYKRNKAYTWQRITSWFLAVAVILHVLQMRFINQPTEVHSNGKPAYLIALSLDEGLYTLADRLQLDLITKESIEQQAEVHSASDVQPAAINLESPNSWIVEPEGLEYDAFRDKALSDAQQQHSDANYLAALKSLNLQPNQVGIACSSFGQAMLLLVRDTFKMPAMVALYSLFVIAAAYHGCNGVWTFLVTWGITVTDKSQKLAKTAVTGLMILLSFLGLAAAWGTYWINLRT